MEESAFAEAMRKECSARTIYPQSGFLTHARNVAIDGMDLDLGQSIQIWTVS